MSATNILPRESFHSLSLKATAAAIDLLHQTISSAALSQLGSIQSCYVGLSFQPVTRSWLAAARASGGDALDLDPADGDFIGSSALNRLKHLS